MPRDWQVTSHRREWRMYRRAPTLDMLGFSVRLGDWTERRL
jgi:hypothetical protein